jgi:integrase
VASVRVRKDTGLLFFDFRFQGVRCREYTMLPDTNSNRKRMRAVLKRIEKEIELGLFDYGKAFPSSPHARRFAPDLPKDESGLPLFRDFARTWFGEKKPEWRQSHIDTVGLTVEKYLIPEFGEKHLDEIMKADILAFRSKLVTEPGLRGTKLSASRVNKIMNPLRMILEEAADRFDIRNPFRGVKSLSVPKSDVEPFTLDEVRLILDNVRKDFRNYYTVRFFTGLRTGEIDGVQWAFVDLKRRLILVRETVVKGQKGKPKTGGSIREVHMAEPVYEALLEQKKVTGQSKYVFCTSTGAPLEHNNVTKRVWYPLLRYLGLSPRRPYQTRHTAATLWLAAGEAPEWIARQMGHSNTEMLFRVYSRYVPNLTRQDGSAMSRLLRQHGFAESTEAGVSSVSSPPAPPAVETPAGISRRRGRPAIKPKEPEVTADTNVPPILDAWF